MDEFHDSERRTCGDNEETQTEDRFVDEWSIGVKTVGKGIGPLDHKEAVASTNSSGETMFRLQVNPNDSIDSLQTQIEATTGLKADQQRLIYRGRLIGSGTSSSERGDSADSQKLVRDIPGLADGHTIHLVQKRAPPEAPRPPSSGGASSSTSSATPSSPSGRGSGSLLASLLGMSPEDDETEANANAGERPRWGFRSSRMPRNSRRPQYRLTSRDLQVPDPGSMEPVRQGLMTLHTMIPHAQQSADHPLRATRQWYRGQWIDCRDTVNQWLEATVVDILDPEDVLPPRRSTGATTRGRCRGRTRLVPNDAAVEVGDIDGRRRLLLEPCEEGDSDEEEGSLMGFRRRDTNDGVQLLLIHYNGWPHRWDEWIRSDSERIRPFRTRTRHPTISSTVSPTPQSNFVEAPSTYITDGDDTDDRAALLPELARTMDTINSLLQSSVPETEHIDEDAQDRTLPWRYQRSTSVANGDDDSDDYESGLDNDDDDDSNHGSDDDEDGPPPLVDRHTGVTYTSSDDEEEQPAADAPLSRSEELMRALDDIGTPFTERRGEPMDSSAEQARIPDRQAQVPRYSRRELEILAPLLDRLGRSLVDAAPHIASLAATLPPDHPPSANGANAHAPPSFTSATSTDDHEEPSESLTDIDHSPDDFFFSGLAHNTMEREESESSPPSASTRRSVDPDHVDFISGRVNTTRGEVRGGPRNRQSGDDVTSLLAAYLAAASLGGMDMDSSGGGSSGEDAGGIRGLLQLLSGRGGGSGGGGGIDIHIHAVVTAPGDATVATATGDGAGLFGVPTTTATPITLGGVRSHILSARDRSRGSGNLLRGRNRNNLFDQEEEDLFSELYSENPNPVNHNTESPHRHHNHEERLDDHLARLANPRLGPGLVLRNSTNNGNGTANGGNGALAEEQANPTREPSPGRRSRRLSGTPPVEPSNPPAAGNNNREPPATPERRSSGGWRGLFGRRSSRRPRGSP